MLFVKKSKEKEGKEAGNVRGTKDRKQEETETIFLPLIHVETPAVVFGQALCYDTCFI